MKARDIIITCLALGLSSAVHAGTWWVDASSTADNPTGKEDNPFTTIQAGVNAAEASGDTELIVKVKPGTYALGSSAESFGGVNCRVVIKKRMTLESTDGKDKTFIVGQKGSGNYDLGDGAIRCICVDGASSSAVDLDGTIIKGFTFKYGATTASTNSPRKEGGGAVCYNGADGKYVIVKDCTATDCQAKYGGAFRGVTAIRCLIRRCHVDSTSSKGSAMHSSRAYCCVFESCGQAGNYEEYALVGDGPYVNCTAIGTSGCLCRSSANQLTYNFISILATRQEFDNTNCGGDYVISTYSNGNKIEHREQVSLTSVNRAKVVVSTLNGDYRPVKNGKADGFGDPQWCKLDWIPSEDQNKDFFGNNFNISGAAGSIDCGAVQGAVEVTSGVVEVKREVKKTSTESASLYYCDQATVWPEQHWFKSDACVVTFDASVPPRFPTVKGGFYLTLPPNGTTLLATEHAATAQLEVGDGKTYSTIQTAIDAAGAGETDYTIVDVYPGTYGPIEIGEKNVLIRSIAGKGETTIQGERDDTMAEYKGCGPNARRCVSMSTGSRLACVEGFTLSGGATTAWTDGDVQGTWSGGAFNAAAKPNHIYNQLCDCTITNCVGWKGAAAWGGWMQRCLITDCINPEQLGADSVVRSAMLSSCVMTECKCYKNQIATDGSELIGCTVVANRQGSAVQVASKTSYIQGSIVCGGSHTKATSTAGSVFYNYVGVMNVTDGFVGEHALVANTARGPFGVLEGSPAIGLWDIVNDKVVSYESWARLVDDFEGKPLEFKDGKATAGAVHTRYVPSIYTLDGTKTLAESMSAACCGDTITVPAGTYASGSVPTEYSFVGSSDKTTFGVRARVSVPAKATLIGEGADTTIISGGYSEGDDQELVRCVLLGTNATLKGFTLANGLVETVANKAEDGNGAAVMADRSAVVEDCVISNNHAYSCGAVWGGTFKRCIFMDNWAVGGVASVGSAPVLENSLFNENRGTYLLLDYERIDNCTFLYNNRSTGTSRISTFGTFVDGAVIRNTAIVMSPTTPDTPMPALYNCLLPKIGSNTWKWAPASTTDCLLSETSMSSSWDGGTEATYVGRDRGNNEYAPEGTDLAGKKRIFDDYKVDIGCYENPHAGMMLIFF